MHLFKKLVPAVAVFFLLGSCNNKATITADQDTATLDGHPGWIMQGNIYEVNVRQYTPEGTFNAFAKHLDRLKEMGVQTLWFMPINPISKTDRKGRGRREKGPATVGFEDFETTSDNPRR